ncbi:pyridoxamine 5'-phosphate oxidase family protein [Nocardioides sp. Root614]|uniref:pyridoxamine 5'-phosphate oxidase family protein n=1 Tax=Nocardioides sp. Root614 TaxID=1736571 RepID=UPI000AD8EBCC|nr:pyridoxamine 5'-phosphate oxidase family protein [Nocardioides sp. Root614]
MQIADRHPGRLVVLSDEECWQLVRSSPIGRVAWAGSEGVSVLPVNFAAEGDTLVLRTTAYSQMARECADRDVAFEVDQIDEEHHSGWSVLLRGRCERQERVGDGPAPWVTGPRVLGLRIVVRSVTGRRLQPPVSSS